MVSRGWSFVGGLASVPRGAFWTTFTTSRTAPFSIEPAASFPWPATLAIGWAIVALGCLLLLARAVFRQRPTLAMRSAVTKVASLEALDRLAQRAGLRHRIRLSHCAGASSPLVLSAREICLPERARELDAAALDAVLAHEIAHIERRDGLWLYGALILQAVLWFQPLNRKARAELQESAELAADDRAVELTGDALGLARTLTHVASWVGFAEPAPSIAMARAGSPIVERVARLVEANDASADVRLASRTPWFVIAALAAIGACSPSVGAPQPAMPGSPPTSVSPPPAPAVVPVVASNSAPLLDSIPVELGALTSAPVAPGVRGKHRAAPDDRAHRDDADEPSHDDGDRCCLYHSAFRAN